MEKLKIKERERMLEWEVKERTIEIRERRAKESERERASLRAREKERGRERKIASEREVESTLFYRQHNQH